MSRQRKPRVLVPFEVGSFLRAPYGWPIQQRRRERGPQRPLSRRTRRRLNAGLISIYLLLAGGAWIGMVLWHGWLGAALGIALGFALLTVGGFVAIVVSAVKGLRETRAGDG